MISYKGYIATWIKIYYIEYDVEILSEEWGFYIYMSCVEFEFMRNNIDNFKGLPAEIFVEFITVVAEAHIK